MKANLNRSEPQPSADSLADRISYLHTDVGVAVDLVGLVENVLGGMQIGPGWASQQRAHACAALIGLEHYLAAIRTNLESLCNELKRQ